MIFYRVTVKESSFVLRVKPLSLSSSFWTVRTDKGVLSKRVKLRLQLKLQKAFLSLQAELFGYLGVCLGTYVVRIVQ